MLEQNLSLYPVSDFSLELYVPERRRDKIFETVTEPEAPRPDRTNGISGGNERTAEIGHLIDRLPPSHARARAHALPLASVDASIT